MNIRYWLIVITEPNWLVIKEKNIYGVPETCKYDIRKLIAKGDSLVFYVSKKMAKNLGGKIVGVYRVSSEWFEGKEPLWPDELAQNKVIYKWRVYIEPIKIGIVEFKELVPKLSFIKNKQRWNAYLIGTPANGGKPISEEDAHTILESMK